MSGPGDPLPRLLDAWREDSPTAEVRRDHMRDWWPTLASILDDLVLAAPVIPRPRSFAGDMEVAYVVAALVRRYGDPHPDEPGVVTAQIHQEDLELIDPGTLTTLLDPGSGGLYFRHRGPAPE